MPFQSVPNTAEIVINGLMGGQQIINTFYAKTTTPYDIGDIINLADGVDEWVGDQWLTRMASNYTYVRTDVRGLNSAIDLMASQDANTGVGGQSACTLSNNASLAVKRGSGFTGRGARGRVYLPPMSAAWMLDDNHVNTAAMEQFQTMLVALDTVLEGLEWIPVIVHRVEAGVPLPIAAVFTVLEWVITDNVVDSMRRRLPRRGV